MKRLSWIVLLGAGFLLFVGRGVGQNNPNPTGRAHTAKEITVSGDTAKKSLTTTYPSYGASFYPSNQLLSLMMKGENATDLEYARSFALFQSLPTSKYRSKRYAVLRRQYDNLDLQIVKLQRKANHLQDQLDYLTRKHRSILEDRRGRKGNTSAPYYESERQFLASQYSLCQSQIMNLRRQIQGTYTQMVQEQLVMYQRALVDESFLKKFMEGYALAGVKKAQKNVLVKDQMKAREEERKAEREWQAWVTFEYLSKYSTLKAKYENKEITFDQFQKQQDKLEKEKLDKLRRTSHEGRDAYKETYKHLTTSVDTTVKTPNF